MKKENEPLSLEEAKTLLVPLEGKACALAVSGGPDSMALALCARDVWGAENVQAFIVEHGLRPESAQEAQDVKARLDAMGFKTSVLPWQHEKITSRVHVQARAARYGLLIEACKAAGRGTLLLAHHRDDQAETVLLRLAKSSGLAGLAGMKKETGRDGVRLFRPFLEVPKARLVATCEAREIPFVRDPSNGSEKYARGRVRRVSEALAQEGFTQESLLDLAARAADATQAVDFYASAFLKDHARAVYGCAVEMGRPAFLALPRIVALAVLARVQRAIGGGAYPPHGAALARLYAFLKEKEGAFALHGCLVQAGPKTLVVLREPAAITEVSPARAGQEVLWDGRWRVLCPDGSEGLEIRALGIHPHAVLDCLAPTLRRRIPSGRVRAGVPCLWRGEAPICVPDSSCDFRELFGPPTG